MTTTSYQVVLGNVDHYYYQFGTILYRYIRKNSIKTIFRSGLEKSRFLEKVFKLLVFRFQCKNDRDETQLKFRPTKNIPSTALSVTSFLPHDASAERGYEIACRDGRRTDDNCPSIRLSVRLSVCDDQVS